MQLSTTSLFGWRRWDYLRLMGDKTIPDSAEPRLESFYPPFVIGIVLPHQGVVDSYNLHNGNPIPVKHSFFNETILNQVIICWNNDPLTCLSRVQWDLNQNMMILIQWHSPYKISSAKMSAILFRCQTKHRKEDMVDVKIIRNDKLWERPCLMSFLPHSSVAW